MTIRNCMRLETQTLVWQEVQWFQSGLSTKAQDD